MRVQLIFGLLVFFANAADFSNYSCSDCLLNQGKYCLDEQDYTKGYCFNPYGTDTASKTFA